MTVELRVGTRVVGSDGRRYRIVSIRKTFDPSQPRDERGQWSSGGGGGEEEGGGAGGPAGGADPGKEFRTGSKGTNDAVNARVVGDSGVRLTAPAALQRDATEALAHVIADSRSNAALLQKMSVEFKDMPGRHGTQKAKALYISAESLREHGPGFAASIIRHELEHKRLSDQGVPSVQQERRVRHTAGSWAAMRYASLARTNPRAASGFKRAAREQGVKLP